MEPTIVDVIQSKYPTHKFSFLKPRRLYDSCIIGVLDAPIPRLAYGVKELIDAASGDPSIETEYYAVEHVRHTLRRQYVGKSAPVFIDESLGNGAEPCGN